MAKAYVFAQDLYRDSAKAREFLNRPHAMLDGNPLLDVALTTDPDANVVIDLLGGVAYGGGA